ncbi:MAG: response regulator [Verrucomicrobiaceae bacterium]
MRIIVAEDVPKMASHIRRGLEEEGHAVDIARDGEEAQWLAELHSYDVLVLDVMMPGKDGFTVVRNLRRKQMLTPVIFLTARSEVEDRIRGLDVGGYFCA